ncbi:MAG TPA: ATP-binding protein [Xanthobacteraceae bacterium]|jgi:CheY-like chemotaxis protein|nr:ATP-binding protein [Xanthobacteraceae bacterium]
MRRTKTTKTKKRAKPRALPKTSKARAPATKRRVKRPRPAKQGSDAIERALAALAHEVRTPLTGILALGELLAASELPERERRWANSLSIAAEHLSQLTTLVVDGAKAGQTALTVKQERFRPRGFADALAGILVGRAEAKGLSAEITIAENLPDLVIGDPVRLRAALENLIDNAVKFTERGSVALDVASKAVANKKIQLFFTITDSGIGLSAAEIKRLFRPFTQASESVARRFGGAGLGLAFVSRIAKAMRGRLDVTSVPGRGSRFRLIVTVELASGAANDVPITAPHSSSRGEGLRILCAEDNPYGRVILNTILVELGHRIDFVGSGEAVIEAAKTGGHDLILMDIALPGIDGIEAAKRIRKLSGPIGNIPIIGISGRGTPTDEAAARAVGIKFYLPKPVSPSALASVLNEAKAGSHRNA